MVDKKRRTRYFKKELRLETATHILDTITDPVTNILSMIGDLFE